MEYHVEEVFDGHKKDYIDLLLLADEREDMIDKYLGRGRMFVMKKEGQAVAECVVTQEGEGVCEIKNFAVALAFWRQGRGKAMVDFGWRHFEDCHTMYVGTGDVPSTMGFYKSCGFSEDHRIKNFFTDNYREPMFEDGKQLVDMVVLAKRR